MTFPGHFQLYSCKHWTLVAEKAPRKEVRTDIFYGVSALSGAIGPSEVAILMSTIYITLRYLIANRSCILTGLLES